MYYRGRSVGRDDKAVQVTCYAESRDGIRWEKPKLRIHDYNGSKENNIVYPAEPRVIAHNFRPPDIAPVKMSAFWSFGQGGDREVEA
jgi:hypothetical protein